MLIVMPISCSPTCSGRDTASSSSRDNVPACSCSSIGSDVASMNTANSSPASRPTTDSFGSVRASRSLSVSSTRSPAAWPKVSLTSLKLSTSRYSSTRPRDWRRLRVIAWCSRCWNCMRFGILVSMSKRAR